MHQKYKFLLLFYHYSIKIYKYLLSIFNILD